MKLDIGFVQAINVPPNIITYTTSTMYGSSGSPCFDRNLRLVVLHHARRPDPEKANEGILINAIVDDLRRQKVEELVTIE